MSQGKIIIVTAPSGSGKTSIVRYLLDKYPQRLGFSISATTRKPRGNEVEGKDYYFLSEEVFKQKIRKNEFVEWEMVYEGKYYGTLESELTRLWGNGKTPVLDIDVKGALHIQQRFPKTAVSIFVEPPSVEELERRLKGRGTESKESLEARVNKAAYELSFKNHFNYTILNNDLEKACKEAESIITPLF
ncbi:MAG: guanylate kinase [Chitinophagaceae bacterium]|nr:guanylate kinase [Chitinophagaceae bacterium]